MSSPKYQRIQDDMPISQSQPSYLEIQPDLPKKLLESTHWVDNEKSPVVPTEDQLEDGPGRTASKHIPAVHQPKSIVMVPVEPTEEPDYMGFSLLATMCCFSPLGIAAFIFSKLTQKANHEGNVIAAQRYSRTAVILALLSLVIGLPLLIFYFIFTKK
uniref:Uncharacterized protein n=1 Tax=Micrurus lemniscatus lemniscatus TaxID=129467 RepID=A0A2D4HKC6_MICLE